MKIGKYWIHRKEQYDLEVRPIICIHKTNSNGSLRIFCVAMKNGELRLWK